jgi:pimeloyl-ACP methyl ester carboxylesterase
MARTIEAESLLQVLIPEGPLRYRDRGSGPPLVFAHPILVNGRIWDPVVDRLAGDFRCLVPDLPLGGHTVALDPGADLSPSGLAHIVAGFVRRLGLAPVTLIGSDTGGGVCQIVATEDPELVASMVLLPCDAYENYLPSPFGYLGLVPRVPGALFALAQSMHLRPLWRLPIAFGRLTKRTLDPDMARSWFRPLQTDRRIRRDTNKVLRALDGRALMKAGKELRSFDRPVLLVWDPDDRVFPVRDAQRLLDDLPDARLELIVDSSTFVQLDQPERTAELIRAFVRDQVRAT